MNKLKYCYLKDTDPQRVLSIGYKIVPETKTLEFAFSLNKVVPRKKITLDQRLRLVMEPQAFRELQKKFRRRFGGDQFSRRTARAILAARFKSGFVHVLPHSPEENSGKIILEKILSFGKYEAGTLSNMCYEVWQQLKEENG